MPRRPSWRRLTLVGGAALLAGCLAACVAAGTTPANTAAAGPDSAAPSTPAAAAGGPSKTASMVCGSEISGAIRSALILPAPPVGRSTWADSLFTCTYRLPYGPLVLSVKETATPAAARAYFTAGRARATAIDTPGLGQAAYATSTGTVVVIKDNDVLTVDATALPAEFGDRRHKRTDIAYGIASAVLGCWTGDDGS